MRASLRHALPWALLIVALAVPLALVARRASEPEAPPSEPLGDLGAVPEFRLIERSGAEVALESLRGEPWIVAFVYTRCEGPCPLVTARMAALASRLPDDGIRLVTISVDPAFDTPERLTAYAAEYRASADRWWFLTGETEAVRRLVRDGFHLSVAEAADDSHGGPLTHSTRTALIDAEGRIRRYYLATEDGWVDAALADVERLQSEAG